MVSTKQNGYQPNPCGIENPVPPKTGSNVDFALYPKKQLIRFCKKFHKDCYRLIGQKMALKDKVQELEQQIERMKCWCNCKNYLSCLEECCRKNISFEKGICYNCKKWEIKE